MTSCTEPSFERADRLQNHAHVKEHVMALLHAAVDCTILSAMVGRHAGEDSHNRSEFGVGRGASAQAAVAKALHVTSENTSVATSHLRRLEMSPLSFCSHRLRAGVTLSLAFLCAILAEVSHHVLRAQQRRSPFNCCAELRFGITQAAHTLRPTRCVLSGKRAIQRNRCRLPLVVPSRAHKVTNRTFEHTPCSHRSALSQHLPSRSCHPRTSSACSTS